MIRGTCVQRLRGRTSLFALMGLITACGSATDAAAPGGNGGWRFAARTTVDTGYYVGFPDALSAAKSCDKLSLVSAQIDGAQQGLSAQLYAAHVVDEGQGHHRYIGGMSEAQVAQSYPNLKLSPVNSAVVIRGQQQVWYVLGVFRPNKAGRFETRGITVQYDCDGSTGSQTYSDVVAIFATRLRGVG